MLREARIVMPHFASQKSVDAHNALQKKLCTAFGGFTSFQGHGGWTDPHGAVVQDMVTIYDVAIDDERDAPYALIARFAIEAGKELDQQAVYVRYPNGTVEIIDLNIEQAITEKSMRLAEVLMRDHVTDALKAIFGDKNVVALDDAKMERFADVGDGRAYIKEGEPEEPKPHPGELWQNRAGEPVFVGRRATVYDGGWYATNTRSSFEYVVDLDGNLHGVAGKSQHDLVKRIH